MADVRPGRDVRGRGPARNRSRHARSFVHRQAEGRPARARPDPRSRGPSGRGALSLAAVALSGLRHALHRGPLAAETRRGGGRNRGPDDHGDAAWGVHRPRALPRRAREPHALDPRAERAGGAYAPRGRDAHGRLEAGPRSPDLGAGRRRGAAAPGRRGSPGDGCAIPPTCSAPARRGPRRTCAKASRI